MDCFCRGCDATGVLIEFILKRKIDKLSVSLSERVYVSYFTEELLVLLGVLGIKEPVDEMLPLPAIKRLSN